MSNAAVSLKRMAKTICPPILMSLYGRCKQSGVTQENFKAWWHRFSKNHLSQDLISMVDYFVRTPAFARSSKYWNWLNMKNIQQLSDEGYDNFRRSVARNYFTWVGGLETSYSSNLVKNISELSSEISIDCSVKEVLKKHDGFSLEESLHYNIITVLLLDYVCKNGGGGLVPLLDEPQEGNPPFIHIQGERISQDLLNSVLEYLSISRGCHVNTIKTIMELGAGFGRTSYCMLKLLPQVKYMVVDIPPALYISQTYLSNAFKDRRVFRFRPFQSFREIEDEFRSSDILFFMPDQLELLPDKIVDLFVAIDCLHEMGKNQLNLYFDWVDRLAHQFFFKCWNKTTVPFDDITYSAGDYPVKKHWVKVYKRNCDVPSTYFEAFYHMDTSE